MHAPLSVPSITMRFSDNEGLTSAPHESIFQAASLVPIYCSFGDQLSTEANTTSCYAECSYYPFLDTFQVPSFQTAVAVPTILRLLCRSSPTDDSSSFRCFCILLLH
eukprot:GHVQ01026121.1.p3 GENE.GHVQ01026121.1~~GHVQ01026121.1.p3  ORF type:complete len:107 (+),score=9.69 GHVQ01026121.1:1711-2031(+)